MALGIHKPGQGYWVRVMTATLIGVLTVATAAWAWSLTNVFIEKYMPRTQYAMRVANFVDGAGQPVTNGAFASAQTVTLQGAPDSTGASATLGTAKVDSYDPAEKRVTISDITMNEGVEPASTSQVVLGDAARPTMVARLQGASTVGLMATEPMYIKGGVAAVIILTGALLAWWLAASRVSTVEKLIATDFEMKKVNWSTPREIIGSTWVVVIACVLLSAAIFTFDILLKNFFTLIHVLDA